MLGGKGTLAQCISKEVFGDEDVELPIRCALILMQFKIWCNLWILSNVAIQYYKIQLICQPWYLTSLQLYWKQSRTISSNSSRLDGISNIHNYFKTAKKIAVGSWKLQLPVSKPQIVDISLHYFSRRKMEINMLIGSFQRLDVIVCWLLHMLPKRSMVKNDVYAEITCIIECLIDK